MTTMIAVNARFSHRRLTGVERYAFEISARLDSAHCLAPARPLGPVAGHLWEQFVLPARLRRGEVLWSPANSGAWIVRKQAVTLHDAGVFDHPEWFRPAFAAWTRLSWRVLARRAEAILTVSEFSCKRLMLRLKIPREKIHVIPNGVGKPFEQQSEKVIRETKEKYGLRKPYFLFVGTLEPRKNLGSLFQAWVRTDFGSDCPFALVIAGAAGKVFAEVSQIGNPTYAQGQITNFSKSQVHSSLRGGRSSRRSNLFETGDCFAAVLRLRYAPLRTAARNDGLSGTIESNRDLLNSIYMLGHVPDEDLPALYAGAKAVVVPSFYEGFGLTALEAMACGAPVIASNTSAFPEVLGEAALYVNPNRADEIADAMQRIAEDGAFANDLRERGLQRAARFSWDDSARKIESVLRIL